MAPLATSCALVSSNGVLLSKSMGTVIDRHDIVARVGMGPTNATFRAHVGQKTTVRFVADSVFEHGKGNLQGLVNFGKTQNIVYLVADKTLLRCTANISTFHSDNFLPPPVCVNKHNVCASQYLGSAPSGGFASVFLLFKMFACSRIRLFGFENAPKASYH